MPCEKSQKPLFCLVKFDNWTLSYSEIHGMKYIELIPNITHRQKSKFNFFVLTTYHIFLN